MPQFLDMVINRACTLLYFEANNIKSHGNVSYYVGCNGVWVSLRQVMAKLCHSRGILLFVNAKYFLKRDVSKQRFH